MSYTPKQQGSGGSGGGNQQSQQAAKSLAGITQQMQNLVHGQNPLPQTTQAGLGAVNFANLNITLQQQFLLSANSEIQQRFQQQIQQQQNAAKDLLNKSLQQHHQQQANGNTAGASLASNIANQQLHQQLQQAFAQNPANIMQHLQAYQYQMQQQQQHQQKMMPLNQTQQSLASSQIDVNAAQQHMQQIQQSFQQQQQKLLATHTKNVASSNQMKMPGASGTSPNPSVSITNTSIQMQSNNNLPNKNLPKGAISSVTQAKQLSSLGPVKAPPVQVGKIYGVPPGGPKTGSISQTAVKPSPPVIYPPKVQSNPVSLTRTIPSTVPSSVPSRLPPSIQQIPKAITSPPLQITAKVQGLPPNYGKSIPNSDLSIRSSKVTAVGVTGKTDDIRPNPIQISQTTVAVPITTSVEVKKQEEPKLSQGNIEKEKDKIILNEVKEKVTQDSLGKSEKQSLKTEIKESKELPGEKQDQEKKLSSIQSGQVKQPTEPASTPSAGSDFQSDNTNKSNDASEKLKQKVPLPKTKPNPRRNIVKNEKEKLEKVEKDKTDKSKTDKEKSPKGKVEKEQIEKVDEKEKVVEETKFKDQEQEKEKVSDEKVSKVQEEMEKRDKEKTEKLDKEKAVEKDKSIKEKVVNISQTVKNERKRTVEPYTKKSTVKAGNSSNQQLSPSISSNDERRSKRHRLKTILYQSPLPELAYITKLSVSENSSVSPRSNNDERLTLFFKSEYLAVRNAEGGFFICQTLQNIYKSSKRIRIRWFSEEKKDNTIFNPDFYDNTDLECILTTVEMEKVEKDRFRLPKSERSRIENILKKAMDVEKGLAPRPDITEENPDGLDISLLKTESQITKSPRRKRVASKSPKRNNRVKSPRKKKTKQKRKFDNEDSSQEDEEDNDNDKEYKPSRNKKTVSSGSEQPKLRAQRSPLAKARIISQSTSAKKDEKSNKTVPVKSSSEVKKEENNVEKNSTQATISDNKNERPKRKAVESVISYDEELVATKRLAVAKQVKKEETSINKSHEKVDCSSIVSTTEDSQTKKDNAETVTISAKNTSTTAKTVATVVSTKRKKLSSSSAANSAAKSSDTGNGNEKDIESSASAVVPSSSSVVATTTTTTSGSSGNRSTRNRK